MNILDTIVAEKRKEVELRKKETPVSILERSVYMSRAGHSLKNFIRDPLRTGIIAEFKRKSPSRGVINDWSGVEEVTGAYASGGASGISVLTDSRFFGGSTADLQRARANEIPILRKDFMVDEYQLIESKSMGADVILLIAACLTPARVRSLAAMARQLGLEVLLELHDETELDHINEFTEIVGINNRNLKTFEVDIEKSHRMAEQIGSSRIRVAESGIGRPDDVVGFREKGFDGYLIGELFMKAHDPGQAFRDFVARINKKNQE